LIFGLAGQCPNYSYRYREPADDVIGIFDDLTATEISNVVQYLKHFTYFNIRDSGDNSKTNGSYIYLIELTPPRKYEALLYLDGRGPKPGRHAKVILLRYEYSKSALENSYWTIVFIFANVS